MTQTTTSELGTLIVNRDGRTPGPRYGQIYTAPQGQRGYIALVRNRAAGNHAYEHESFATLAQAQDYLCRIGAY